MNIYIAIISILYCVFYLTHLIMYFSDKNRKGYAKLHILKEINNITLPSKSFKFSHFKFRNNINTEFHASMIGLNDNYYYLDPIMYLIFSTYMNIKWITSKKVDWDDSFEWGGFND